jgi:formylglycine-generating enzyme required for sulfatase activity
LTRPVIVEDAKGSHRFEAGDFPLSVGGPGTVVSLPGFEGGEPAGWIGVADRDLFLQVSGGGERVFCNGVPVTTSHWLHGGDRVRIGSARITIAEKADGVHLHVERAPARNDGPPPIQVATVAAPVNAGESSGVTIRPVEFRPRQSAEAARRRRRLRAAPVLAVLFLAILAGAIGFLLTARAVQVEIEPAPDRMSIRGGFSGIRIAGHYLLRPGRYTLVAEKQGYHRLETVLEVQRHGDTSTRFTLEKLPGLVTVDSGQVHGAEVIVDGAGVGRTPLPPVEVAPGEHEIRVRAERYREFLQRILVEGGGSEQTVIAELEPDWAGVSFDSDPPGARVRAGGKTLGVTPLTADLEPGRHEIEYRLEGHKVHHDSVTVVAGEPMDLPAVKLELLDGKLVLRSEPAGAAVQVDGDYRGQTPVEIYLSPGRTHFVQLSKTGHDPASRDVILEGGEAREVAVTLTAREGELQLQVLPGSAEVIVNGESRGEARGTLQLPAVPQEIEIRKEGFEPYRTTLTPRPGFPQTLQVTLEPSATPEDVGAKQAPPKVAETPQGHPLILIPPGRFQMGASRREPGRRANETLREVELTRAFYLSAREISNQEFREFKPEHGSGFTGGHSLDPEDRPVVSLTWEEAALFCNFLSEKESLPPAYVKEGERIVAVRPPTTGYRLPLEAEWAWAARYPDGTTALKYPWGESLPVPPGSGNYADASATGLLSRVLTGYDDTYPVTAPVGSMEPNARGLYHLGDNVAEWIHDLYTIPPSGAGVERDPSGAEDGELHVIRGASWMKSSVSELRLSYRDYGAKARPDVGFRVARYAE